MELPILFEFQKNVVNDHITPFLGWYLEDGNLCIVTENTHNTLIDYLQQLESPDNHQEEFQKIIRQISSGMCALELKKVEHRDLAARNIFLDKSKNVRIGNFGLSRPIGTRYNAGSPNPKWSAPEVLQDENNSDTKSDVWSFGVTIWEIYTLGSEPYENIANKDLFQILLSGSRLEIPMAMPNRIGNLMNSCWNLEPGNRPSFAEIYANCVDYAESTYI
ncbi:unnamed protein product [Rodentolepis nana]|uniref:Non-specific protein-tyrosine kinase n=1 Tax=Rodentolepis nana TaxID=102285 RepID=A0A0R3TIL6_RODNA|nr:unnamed protein product [Rodentolepis nana]